MIEDGIVVVRVFGVPTASSCGPQDGWRDATEWIARSLKAHFGEQIRVEYYDLFSAALDAFPKVIELVARGEAQPPLVFVGDELLSSGGRISGPAIRRRLEASGLAAMK
jgi:disulfide oxidoreductase YuzD